MDTERLYQLMDRYLEERISAPEKQELLGYLADPATRAIAEERIGRQLADGLYSYEGDLSELEAKIGSLIAQKRKGRIALFRPWRWAAAAVFLLAIAGTWFLVKEKPASQNSPIAYKGNVAPGREGAKLKLSDGRVILVDSLRDGLIATDGKVAIRKENGRIVYEGTTDAIAYNEVIADKGRQASAELPDGSVVYLNAGSSLRYPLHFSGRERVVDMTGEVYFEVIHNSAMPFKVRAGNTVIEDIGTVFNVNAYANEPATVTTLVEGSLKIDNHVLTPNQQYSFPNNAVATSGKVSQADVNKAIAWHKGLFSFDHTDLATMMRQLERWYNVEVKYEGPVPAETFTGEMKRNLTLAEVLDFMQSMHVKFRIEEDKKIVITP